MNRFFNFAGFLILVLASQPACSSVYKTDDLLDARSLVARPPGEALRALAPGSVVVVSENHGFQPHHDKQVQVMNEVALQGKPVHVAMEFYDFTQQKSVDDFLSGILGEADFLKAVAWGKLSFDFYRRQTLFPVKTGGRTLAINAPRALTGKISKNGLSSLTPAESALLPPGFTLGNDLYRARFARMMAGHVDEAALQRYFEAQSVWDDTMAFNIAQFHGAHPGEPIVVIVGDFHAAYYGGLPDRLRARGVRDLTVISQVNLSGATDSEEREEVEPHPTDGPRADYIWISR